MAKKHHKRKTSKSHPNRQHKRNASVVADPERIVSSRMGDDGEEQFRLRWKNCEAADDSWRTRTQLEGLEELLETFMSSGGVKRVGFKETATLKRMNAAGNSIVEEIGLKG